MNACLPNQDRIMTESHTARFFVTGPRDCGKSFLIEMLEESQDSLTIRSSFNKKRDVLTLVVPGGHVFLVAARGCNTMNPYRDAFDEASEIIEQLIPGTRLLLIDELGYLEECSDRFMSAISLLLKRSARFVCILREDKGVFVGQLKKEIPACFVQLERKNQQDVFKNITASIEKPHENTKGKDFPSPGGDGGI